MEICHVGTYIDSPQDPSAGSYKPPGIGFKRLSNVVGFSIFLTEIALISAGVRKSKSTVSIAEEIGCEIFMVPRVGNPPLRIAIETKLLNFNSDRDKQEKEKKRRETGTSKTAEVAHQ